MVETTENKEAVIVLISAVSSGIAGFLAAAPIPTEWRMPLIGLAATVTGAVLLFWKLKVNVKT